VQYSPSRRTALVLCGTGAHGAYHAGVLRALQEAGVRIDLVAGHGVGAAGAAARRRVAYGGGSSRQLGAGSSCSASGAAGGITSGAMRSLAVTLAGKSRRRRSTACRYSSSPTHLGVELHAVSMSISDAASDHRRQGQCMRGDQTSRKDADCTVPRGAPGRPGDHLRRPVARPDFVSRPRRVRGGRSCSSAQRCRGALRRTNMPEPAFTKPGRRRDRYQLAERR